MAGSGPVAQKTALNSPSYRAVLRGWAFRPGTDADARTPAQLAAAWRHRGLRVFEAEKEASAA